MSKLIRLSDGTYQRIGIKPGESLGVVPNPQPDFATMECGLCVARAEMTDEVMDRWLPEVWLVYPDGREVGVGVACNRHKCTYDEVSGVHLAYVDSQGNYPE